jgi:hypothetical protein
VAEGGGLLNRYTVQSRIKGSNPFLSATLAAALLLGASAQRACAQANLVERSVTAASGRDVRVGVYTSIRPDCTSGPLPAIRLMNAPAHGAVNVKRATFKATNFKQCLAIEAPALVAFYHAASGFNGADDFQFEVTFAGGRKEIQHFQVSVSNTPVGGQGI